jgi:hypothetical protein
LTDELNSVKIITQDSQTKLQNIQITKVDVGYLKFTGKFTFMTKTIEISFTQNFESAPRVVFALANMHIGDNRAPLWSIYNLQVDRYKLTANIQFYGAFHSHQLDILWMAFGK